MLYKFKSKATGDVMMLAPNGHRLLEIIGKAPDAKGIILPFQMPMAIAAIEAAIYQEETKAQEMQDAKPADSTALQAVVLTKNEEVSLKQRAFPLLNMLKQCYAADVEIVWGV